MFARVYGWLKWAAGCAIVAGGLTPAATAAALQVLDGHVPAAVARVQPVGTLDGSRRLHLAIGLPLRDQQILTALLRQLYDPASPNYHRYLRPEQFAQRFGPTENDYQALIAFAESNGLKVTQKHGNRMLLDVDGSAGQIEKAFHVKLRLYPHPSEARTFYAPDVEPSVDAALAILHVSGLDNYLPPHPANLDSSDGRRLAPRKDGGRYPVPGNPLPLSGSGPGGSYLGEDFRAAYLPGVSLNGAGQQVALAEFDGYYSNDIVAYQTQAGLPSVTISNVLLDGFNGSAGPNADEVSLDIEMVISMAPSIAQVISYEAGPNGLGDDVLNRMATDNLAQQLSSSWTLPTDQTTSQIFRQFAAQGQSYFNASGDSDAYSGPVAAPADNPYVTVVGGTSLSTSAAGGSWVSETVWNRDNGDGSGGGISTTFQIPPWQQGVSMSNNMGSATMRNIPDVAGVAANVWIIYGGGSVRAASGTSCATPLWAALTALVNQQAAENGLNPVGFLNPALYAIGQSSNYTLAFHDIVTGNNTNSSSPNRFFAVAGYDLCTGWGSPNGQPLIDALAPPDTLQVLPASGFASSGPAGGPFSEAANSVVLTNRSAAALSWSLGVTASWLTASPLDGSLVPGAVTNVLLALGPLAATLPPGAYAAAVKVTNSTSGVVHVLAFTLNVYDPLVISPQNGFAASGEIGGPFNISAVNFQLTNEGPAPLSWSLAGSPPWLDVSPNAGILGPGQEWATVQVSLNSNASNLATGTYSATLIFSNLTIGTAQNQPATLSVGEPAVQNGGFETGNFSGWTLSGNGASVFVSTDNLCVHSGTYGAELGPPYSLGYLSQTVPTLPGRIYLISLWLDSPDGQTPNQFLVSWNGDTLFNQTNLPALGWTNIQIMAAATGPNTVLEIGFRDDPTFLGLDDISATLVAQPVAPAFESVVQSASGIVLTWGAVAGEGYQLQYNNDLNSTNWTNSGALITAATPTGRLTNAMTNGQRFFRLLQINPP
jgi:hypothetical protein